MCEKGWPRSENDRRYSQSAQEGRVEKKNLVKRGLDPKRTGEGERGCRDGGEARLSGVCKVKELRGLFLLN